MKRKVRNEEMKRRRKRRREERDPLAAPEEKLERVNVGPLNALNKAGEQKRRRNYIHDYVLSSNWPDTVLICLVNMLKRKWEFLVDADDIDLFEELRGYLFLERE